jgi:hypothetical protein
VFVNFKNTTLLITCLFDKYNFVMLCGICRLRSVYSPHPVILQYYTYKTLWEIITLSDIRILLIITLSCSHIVLQSFLGRDWHNYYLFPHQFRNAHSSYYLRINKIHTDIIVFVMYSDKSGLLATGVWSSDTNVSILNHNIFDYKFGITILTIILSQSDIHLIKILYLAVPMRTIATQNQ